MLSKKNRVTTGEVERIFKEGSFAVSAHLTFKYIKTGTKGVKISFIAPKSVSKMAVKRNLLRRHGYDALKTYITDFPSGIIGVFVFKKYQEDLSIIENEIKSILNKIN